MRIVVHDYSGHPFQVQLSRELASRGHTVRHIYCSSFQTPKGNLAEGESPRLEIVAVTLPSTFRKEGLLKRRRQEIEVGRLVARSVAEFCPDVVISSNAPLDTQRIILAETRRQRARFIFWLQDIYSEAIGRILPRRLPVAGHFVGRLYRRLEFGMLRRSDHVVAITDDFREQLHKGGIAPERVSVIENWAPLDEMASLPRDNPWAEANLAPGLRIVYSGTLGYKHDHSLLSAIARAVDGHVHVFSEGVHANRLAAEAESEGIGNLTVRGWVPFEDLPALLAGADIFVAMIGEDAGVFSVPSKVLTYLCAGRPIVAAIPEGNLARTIIEREGAGIAFSPSDRAGLVDGIRALAADPARREAMARRARAYAEQAFDIARVTDGFERVFAAAQVPHTPRTRLTRAAAAG